MHLYMREASTVVEGNPMTIRMLLEDLPNIQSVRQSQHELGLNFHPMHWGEAPRSLCHAGMQKPTGQRGPRKLKPSHSRSVWSCVDCNLSPTKLNIMPSLPITSSLIHCRNHNSTECMFLPDPPSMTTVCLFLHGLQRSITQIDKFCDYLTRTTVATCLPKVRKVYDLHQSPCTLNVYVYFSFCLLFSAPNFQRPTLGYTGFKIGLDKPLVKKYFF